MEAFALQVTALFSVGRGLCSACCLPFKLWDQRESQFIVQDYALGTPRGKEGARSDNRHSPGRLINVVSLSL